MNPFLDSCSKDRPQKMLDCDRRFGHLSEIHHDDECIVATIGKRKVVLPVEMEARLEPFMQKRIGLARFDDEYYLRELS